MNHGFKNFLGSGQRRITDRERSANDTKHVALREHFVPKIDSDITPLMDRCRQILRYVKSHRGTKEAFHVAQKKEYETYIRERKVAKINFDLDVVNYNTKMEAFRKGILTDEPQQPVSLDEAEPTKLKELTYDVTTRWNSLLLCICRIIENSAPLELIWEEFGDGNPLFCEEEWQSIEAIATFLDNFDTLTNLVQGDFVLASEARLVVKKFKDLLNITDVDHKMVKSLKAGIKSHMDSNRAKLS